MNKKSTFAVMFGNRGFFPASLIAQARQEVTNALKVAGYGVLLMDENLTRYGAVETPQEGQQFARFLQAHRGEYDGVIISLPNFGDETGAVAAVQDAGTPIFIQAYPDDLDKMAPELRRDAFCGKLSIMDVFYQYNLKFSVRKPHTVHPSSPVFLENMDYFDRVCRVVKGMRRMTVGAIGARTTPFKTVRVDEVALQRRGVTVETFDFSDVIARVNALKFSDPACKDKAEVLRHYTSWEGVPDAAFENLTRLGVVLDQMVAEAQLDAVAIRCWLELQKQLHISVCVLMGEMNNRGIPAACEVDVANAVMMYALQLASGSPAALLDWNNNYGEDENRCILFHCGPVPVGLMQDPGHIEDHAILANAVGKGCSFGCQVGRIKPCDFTFGSLLTDSGKTRLYLGQGTFTEDPVPADFFGCAGVAQIDRLQDVLLHIGKNGYRHHVGVTAGKYQQPLAEALGDYLGYEINIPQGRV